MIRSWFRGLVNDSAIYLREIQEAAILAKARKDAGALSDEVVRLNAILDALRADARENGREAEFNAVVGRFCGAAIEGKDRRKFPRAGNLCIKTLTYRLVVDASLRHANACPVRKSLFRYIVSIVGRLFGIEIGH